MKSLYGHPKAGRWWQDHLDEAKGLGCSRIANVPSNYTIDWFSSDGCKHQLLLNVYIDDLTLCGNLSCHGAFWAKLQETVKLEDATFIDAQRGGLILGRKHVIDVHDTHIRTLSLT